MRADPTGASALALPTATVMAAPARGAPLLSLHDVDVRAGGVAMLAAVSLDIPVGAPTVLLGPNGSGKTTLLKLAMGLIEPSRGRVEVAHARTSAFVFQRPVMLRRSAAANVAFARAAAGLQADRDAVARLLDRVGLAHVAERPARKLSGGEQQRLALARALAREPSILFLDEPTASLDPATTKLIEDIIASVGASGVKIVMATHDLGQARRLAGDVVFLAKGRVVECAPGATFFLRPATEAARRFLAGDLVL